MTEALISYAPAIGLVGFFTAFVLIAVMTYRPQNRQRIEGYGNIPFKEQE